MRAAAVLFSLVIVPFASAATPRITFDRLIPAAHDLGRAEEIALVSAPADDPHAELFVEQFVAAVNRSPLLRVRDVRFSTGPAEVHLDVKSVHCETTVNQGEGGMRDVDGRRVKRRYETADAMCVARVDVLTRFLKYRSTFYGKGAGASRRVDRVGDEERREAIEAAVRYAASDAAERITPRRVRESIALDETATAFEEGMAMIDAGRFAEARTLWEAAVKKAPRDAALRYNLGAVCEAMRDRRAAELHYNAARQLAPAEPRYANELKLFSRRLP